MICSNCGYKLDYPVCLTDEKATLSERDILICFNCGEVHQLRNGILELIDIKDIPKDVRDLVLKTNIVRNMVKKSGIIPK